VSAGKISWMIDENDWLTIIKVDGLAFPAPVNGEDAAKSRLKHMQKYKIGTQMSLEQFCNNEDYNSIMWSIVPETKWTRSNADRRLVINV